MRVSNAAAAVGVHTPGSPPSHSRIPSSREMTAVPRPAASRRVEGQDMLKAWVGPPTTSRVTSAGTMRGAAATSTTSVCIDASIPSATARATACVFPNIDS